MRRKQTYPAPASLAFTDSPLSAQRTPTTTAQRARKGSKQPHGPPASFIPAGSPGIVAVLSLVKGPPVNRDSGTAGEHKRVHLVEQYSRLTTLHLSPERQNVHLFGERVCCIPCGSDTSSLTRKRVVPCFQYPRKCERVVLWGFLFHEGSTSASRCWLQLLVCSGATCIHVSVWLRFLSLMSLR